MNRSIGLVASIVLLIYLAPEAMAQVDYSLYESVPRGPVGGGSGYTNAVSYDGTFALVDTVPQLRHALADPSIDRIFIAGDAVLEVDAPLEINRDGLVLASDRGRYDDNGKSAPGALLTLMSAAEGDNDLLIAVNADGVRITGLRMHSEDIDVNAVGVRIGPLAGRELVSMEVDNCELSNFGYAAVRIDGLLTDGDGITRGVVHHNHIHHNNKPGLGYGTVINYRNAHGEILYNLYDENRHSVAGNGRAGERYVAAYNLTLENAMSSEYDMHGYSDFSKRDCDALAACKAYCDCNTAGAEVILLNNAVVETRWFFGLRGIPQQGAYVTRNFHSAQDFYKLWRTWTYTDEIGPCHLPEPNDAHINLDRSQWPAYRLSVWENNVNPQGRNIVYVSWAGVNSWKPLFFNAYRRGSIAYGDFDGDGTTDIFYGDGTNWYFSASGVTPWQRLATSGYTVDSLAFGHFDDDAVTDVFLANGTEWKISRGGRSQWEPINTSGYTTDQLGFGDFDGNGITDVFLATGSEWKVSWAGRSSWKPLNTSRRRLPELAFGNFDDDTTTDVFLGTGSQWLVSFSGTSRWEPINTSSNKTRRLAFGDFDGNGTTDVFIATGSQWRVSWDGRSSWQPLNTSGYRLRQLGFGDFDGDSKTDVIREASF